MADRTDPAAAALDLAYTAATVALEDARATVGGTAITGLAPPVAAGKAVTAAAPHLRAAALEQLADRQARHRISLWAFAAGAPPVAALGFAAVWAALSGYTLVTWLCAAAVVALLAGLMGMLRVDAAACRATLEHLDDAAAKLRSSQQR